MTVSARRWCLPSAPPSFLLCCRSAEVTFTYDGDGKRVKSVIQTNYGTTTTHFVGSYYEVTANVVTKYYYAGSQRVATSNQGQINFLLGDHLGSTSLVTDQNGNKISEIQYKAWGEARYASGNMPTKYQYTGQYNQAEFGLYFYNARWYDNSLGRFIQADSIIPGGLQGLDRYAYTSNNPMRYTDPSGHKEIEEPCDSENDHYCQTGNGAVVDTKHYSNETAAKFWRDMLRAWTGKQSTITLDATVGEAGFEWKLIITYKVYLFDVKDEDQLRQIGAGIWWDFQIRMEMWEGTLPPGLGGLGRSRSTFQNEDIPSTFLAYVAATHGGENKGWGFDDVMAKMGGAAASSHLSGGTRSSTIKCVTTAICDGSTSRNSSIYFKIQNDDGVWAFVPYPEELNVIPITDSQYYTLKSCSTDSNTFC